MSTWASLLQRVTRIGRDLLSPTRRPVPPTSDGGRRGSATTRARSAPTADRARVVTYAPDLDGAADPGEIVWGWVPFEENDGRGKDRPLLIVGRARGELLGLMLSSQSDHAGERDWVSVGSGGWDRQGRESFVRLDRVLEIGERDIRREGAVLDRDRFERVAGELRGRFGWS